MLAASRRFLPLVITPILAPIMLLTSARALADTWIKPTQEELQMTAEPAAPGAAAIYLLRDERADDKLHVHITYVRLKVLTDKGKESADQEISYEGGQFSVFGVEGRTIHSDGTVIPFTGKPYQKVLEIGGTEKYKATVFTLPDVQVGSILEYRYVLSYDSKLVVSPRWYLQGPLYIRKAHFQFIPSDHVLEDGHGGVMQGRLAYSAFLPPGGSVAYSPAGKYYTLDVEKIPASPEEEFMPPMHNYTFRALFALDKRTTPVDLDYPFVMQDTVSIKLPSGLDIESLPRDTEVTYPQNAFYRAKFIREPGVVKSVRVFAIGNVVYKPEENPELKDFYQKVNAKDKEPAVLQFTQAATAPGAARSVATGKSE